MALLGQACNPNSRYAGHTASRRYRCDSRYRCESVDLPSVSTPIRNQYLRLKAQFPGALMFVRLGDFYEMFDDDALTGSRELELTLTAVPLSRSLGAPRPPCRLPGAWRLR
jgi:MutS domain I